MEQAVTVGRIVHVVTMGECRAAIVTEVVNGGPGIGIDSISVCVLHPDGAQFLFHVVEDAQGKASRTWHWPERV